MCLHSLNQLFLCFKDLFIFFFFFKKAYQLVAELEAVYYIKGSEQAFISRMM